MKRRRMRSASSAPPHAERRSARQVASVLLLAVLPVVLAGALRPVPAAAMPIYAARERLLCTSCHVDPSGGGLRNSLGFSYLRNRHAFTTESRFGHLPAEQPEIVDNLPVGGDVRVLYDALSRRHASGSFPNEVSSFFRMQAAFYLSYAPSDQVRLYYNQDLDGVRDVWAQLGNLPAGGYVRAGAFRLPYGLRMEDHTIYQRDDLETPVSVLGFDPRQPDVGVEFGVIRSSLIAQAAVTNGSNVGFDSDRNKAFTARGMGLVGPALFGGSVHLDSDGQSTATEHLRYGGFASVNPLIDLVLLGAIDLGEDERGDVTTPVLLAWAEADYFYERLARFRLRYEFLDKNRDEEFADSERYTVEGDLIPVPFAAVRLSYRFTSNEDELDIEELIGMVSVSF